MTGVNSSIKSVEWFDFFYYYFFFFDGGKALMGSKSKVPLATAIRFMIACDP
jgi:hypothetical protein